MITKWLHSCYQLVTIMIYTSSISQIKGVDMQEKKKKIIKEPLTFAERLVKIRLKKTKEGKYLLNES